MSNLNIEELHIPEGINYDCQGCGICCSGWSVNMTAEDYARISKVNWGELKAEYKGKNLFRELKAHEKAGTNYTNRMISQNDTCPFLVDKLCFIHGQKGSTFKPTICQQFPYAFTDTPSGTYATVSFVSMAVLYNQGTPLKDQRETIEKKLSDFRILYPHYKVDWSKIQLSVQQPLTWDEYLIHESELIKYLNDKSKRLNERLWLCSDYLTKQVSLKKQEQLAKTNISPSQSQQNTSNSEKENNFVSEQSLLLNKLDKQLLSTFHKLYFPKRAYRANFSPLKFWLSTWFNASTVLEFTTEHYAIDQIKEFPFPDDDPEIEDMLYRYVYSLIFGKKYFGSGFAHLSLVTGFNHLIISYTLARLHARGLAKSRKAPKVSLLDMAASLKQLETQMGEIIIGGYGASVLELLLQSPHRARRFLAL